MSEMRNVVHQFILNEFLPGEPPELMTDSTPLVTGGILDSIATMKLAGYLRTSFTSNSRPTRCR